MIINVLFCMSVLLAFTAGMFTVFYSITYSRNDLAFYIGTIVTILSGIILVIH